MYESVASRRHVVDRRHSDEFRRVGRRERERERERERVVPSWGRKGEQLRGASGPVGCGGGACRSLERGSDEHGGKRKKKMRVGRVDRIGRSAASVEA